MLGWWCKFTSASFFYIPLISSFFSPQIKFQLLKGLNRVPGFRFLLIKILKSVFFSYFKKRWLNPELVNHLHGHDTFPRKKVNLIGSWSVEKFSNFQRNRKKKSQADPIWRLVKAARGLWRGKRDRNEKKKRKNPSSNSNWPGSWTERFSRSICIFARPSAAAGLSFFFPLKRKDFNFWRKILFQDSFKIVFFRWECISNGKSHRGDFSLSFWHYLADKWPQIQIERGCDPWCISINPLNLRLRRMDLLTGKSGHRHTHTHLALTAQRPHRSLLAATN